MQYKKIPLQFSCHFRCCWKKKPISCQPEAVFNAGVELPRRIRSCFCEYICYIGKNSTSCRGNVDATKINMSLNVFFALAEYSLDAIFHSHVFHFHDRCFPPLLRPLLYVVPPFPFRPSSYSIAFHHLFEDRFDRYLQLQEIAFFVCVASDTVAHLGSRKEEAKKEGA